MLCCISFLAAILPITRTTSTAVLHAVVWEPKRVTLNVMMKSVCRTSILEMKEGGEVCAALLPNVLVLENINVSYLHACPKCKNLLSLHFGNLDEYYKGGLI